MATQRHADDGGNVRSKHRAALKEGHAEADRIRESLHADGVDEPHVWLLGRVRGDTVRVNVLLDVMTPTAVDVLRDDRYEVREYGHDCALVERRFE